MGRQSVDLVVVGDVGATNCRIGVSSRHGLLTDEILPTPQHPEQFFDVLGGHILRLAAYHKAGAAAIALAGPVRMESGTETVGPLPNIPAMQERFNFRERLTAAEPRLRNFPLLTLNDAAAAAHASARYFAEDKNRTPLTYLSIKTGVGGDSIVGYETFSYLAQALSEYGQIPFRQPDGSYATLENRISGRAIQQLYGDGARDAKAINADPRATSAWDNVGRDLARGIGVLTPLIGMTQVIIGGGVGANAYRRYETSLNSELRTIRGSWPAGICDLPKVQYLPPDLDRIIGLRGCYFAAIKRFAGM